MLQLDIHVCDCMWSVHASQRASAWSDDWNFVAYTLSSLRVLQLFRFDVLVGLVVWDHISKCCKRFTCRSQLHYTFAPGACSFNAFYTLQVLLKCIPYHWQLFLAYDCHVIDNRLCSTITFCLSNDLRKFCTAKNALMRNQRAIEMQAQRAWQAALYEC